MLSIYTRLIHLLMFKNRCRQRRSFALSFLIFVLILSTFGCGRQEKKKTKVFFLCVDGLTWSVLKEGMSKGRLKNFDFIIKNGSSGVLRSIPPTASPAIWTTIATGKRREKHGVKWFRLPDDKRGKLVLATSAHRKVKAIWNILSEKKKKVGVVGYYVTWPVEKINGVMVSDRTLFPIKYGFYPPELKKRFKKNKYFPDELEKVKKLFHEAEWYKRGELLEKSNSAFFDTLDKLAEDFKYLVRDFDSLLRIDKYGKIKAWKLFFENYPVIGDIFYYYLLDNSRLSMAKVLFDKDYDFFTLYLQGTDKSSHMTWKYYDDSYEYPVNKRDVAFFKDIIPNYYAYIDRVIGYFLAQIPKDSVFIVASDHGFRKRNKFFLFDINNMLNKMGLLDYDKEKNIKRDKAYDTTPYWLAFYHS